MFEIDESRIIDEYDDTVEVYEEELEDGVVYEYPFVCYECFTAFDCEEDLMCHTEECVLEGIESEIISAVEEGIFLPKQSTSFTSRISRGISVKADAVPQEQEYFILRPGGCYKSNIPLGGSDTRKGSQVLDRIENHPNASEPDSNVITIKAPFGTEVHVEGTEDPEEEIFNDASKQAKEKRHETQILEGQSGEKIYSEPILNEQIGESKPVMSQVRLKSIDQEPSRGEEQTVVYSHVLMGNGKVNSKATTDDEIDKNLGSGIRYAKEKVIGRAQRNVFESGYLSSTSKTAIECFDEDGEEAAPPRMEKIEVYSSRKEMPHQFLDPNNPKIICPICNQAVRLHNFPVHHRRHTGARPFSCEHCERRFRTAQLLKEHVRSHTGEKPYGCAYCLYRASSKRNVDRHIRRRHQGKVSAKIPITRSGRNRIANLEIYEEDWIYEVDQPEPEEERNPEEEPPPGRPKVLNESLTTVQITSNDKVESTLQKPTVKTKPKSSLEIRLYDCSEMPELTAEAPIVVP